MDVRALKRLAIGVGALLIGGAAPGLAAPPRDVVLDRLTYIDETHRNVSDPRFLELGFSAKRSAESVGADVPESHTPYLIASGQGPDQLQTLTIDLDRGGQLDVAMLRGPSPAFASAVRGTAAPDAKVQGGNASWTIRNAKPGTYTFSVHFRARGVDPNLRSFLPETEVTLRSEGETRRLVLKRHSAPLYGSPELHPGHVYGPVQSTAVHDEWVAHPTFSAMGAHHWSTGVVTDTRSAPFQRLAPGADGALNTASMGTAYSGDVKVAAVYDFIYEGRELAGFEIGAQTADVFGQFFPFTTNPQNGRIYEGDGGQLTVSMSAGSGHWDKRSPRNDDGVLRWDWDGAWAEGWSNFDSFRAPGIRGLSDPIYTTEAAIYPGAYGGDLDNRSGARKLRGPKWSMDLPQTQGISFISTGWSAPPRSKFALVPGFTSDGRRFILRPTIGRGGYLLEAETDGYDRHWQPPVLVGGSFFGVAPEEVEEEEPGIRRVYTFPRGSIGHIAVAATTGLTERFEVAPGIWEITATANDVNLRLLKTF